MGTNYSSAKIVIQCAFGRLKAQFGILQQPMDLELDNIITTIDTCFILIFVRCIKQFVMNQLGPGADLGFFMTSLQYVHKCRGVRGG